MGNDVDDEIPSLNLVYFTRREGLASIPEGFRLCLNSFALIFKHHPRGTPLLDAIESDLLFLGKLDGLLFQVSGGFRHQHHILKVDILYGCVVFSAERAFVPMNFKYDSRFGVRLPVRTSPSSLALPRVSYDNFITWLDTFRSSESICQISSLNTGVFQPTQYSNSDLAIIAEQVPDILTHWLKLVDSKGLQLFVERCGQRPSPVDVSRRVSMGTRRIVNNELHNVNEFAGLVGKALHDVFHQHSHDLLGFQVPRLNKTLLHGPPRSSKPMPQPDQRTILGHEGILKLRPSIATNQRGQGPAPHDTTREHSACLIGGEAWTRLNENPMA